MIIFLQTFSFSLKISDSDSFDIDLRNVFKDEIRLKYFPIHFLSSNYNTVSILETIALVFILSKVVDGLRIIQRLNVIINTLVFSFDLILVFIILFVVFQVTLVPLAQAIWGY